MFFLRGIILYMTDGQRLDKLYNWAFLDNGIKSADKRIVDNTERIEKIEDYPCRDGCLFIVNEEKEAGMRTQKRSFRIGDIANYIQLAVLLLIVYGMFYQ